MNSHHWEINDIDQRLIELALQEDLNVVFTDVTTSLLFPEDLGEKTVKLISKHPEPIILSGLPVLKAILDAFQTPYELTTTYKDGDKIPPHSDIISIHSSARTLLMAERIILNFLRQLCAVATLTRKFVDAVNQTQLKILDTRKTTPGFRHLEKYAAACGGGVNHRLGLYDAIMIKDTHIDLAGGVEKALSHLPNETDFPVIVEVRSSAELKKVIKYGKNKVNRVLLDNMDIAQLKTCVEEAKEYFDTEASGSITLDNIAAISKTGVQFASVGMITHSAGNVDLSIKAN